MAASDVSVIIGITEQINVNNAGIGESENAYINKYRLSLHKPLIWSLIALLVAENSEAPRIPVLVNAPLIVATPVTLPLFTNGSVM